MNKKEHRREIQNGKCLIFLHFEVLGKPRTIFERHHPGYSMVFAMKNLHILPIFGCVL